MDQKDDDLEEIIIVLLILCICFFCMSGIGYKIYDFYDTYTNDERNTIKSFSDMKDFFKEMLEKLWDWIQCNIMGLFSENYKKKCFTDAVILSQEDEIKLDSANPGNLGEALWELTVDQKRQTEDYERADEALNNLRQAIMDKDAPAIFYGSDEVVKDEEILFYRAWITAQTAQMTHNMVNMEICDGDSNIIDYMDLAATGKEKDGQDIPGKTGKDFRWSNRCKNTHDIAGGYAHRCNDPSEDLTPSLKDTYWLSEGTANAVKPLKHDELNKDNTQGPSGIDARPLGNDAVAFGIGDFSGYTCDLYSKYFCKDGYPDYDANTDMFGMIYNWPELNCCACGGGSLPYQEGGSRTKNKYELISKLVNFDADSNIENGNENSIITYDGNIDYDTMRDCIDACDVDGEQCAGLVFDVEGVNISELDPQIDFPFLTHYNPFQQLKENIHGTHDKTQLYKKNTCRKIYSDKHGNVQLELDTLFNRNSFYRDKASLDSIDSTRLLKKMPSNFQNINTDSQEMSSESGGIDTDYKSYPLEYDLPVQGNCAELCSNLKNNDGSNDYKPKSGEECPEAGCTRKECCKLNTCGNDPSINCVDESWNKKANVICNGPCTTDQCCTKDMSNFLTDLAAAKAEIERCKIAPGWGPDKKKMITLNNGGTSDYSTDNGDGIVKWEYASHDGTLHDASTHHMCSGGRAYSYQADTGIYRLYRCEGHTGKGSSGPYNGYHKKWLMSCGICSDCDTTHHITNNL